METEVWFRNPSLYIREAKEIGVTNFTWDAGLLRKRGIDLSRFMEVHYGVSTPWRAIIVADKGGKLVSPASSVGNAEAVYPTWAYGEDFERLKFLVENPAGENEATCISGDAEWRPRFGQDHYVIVTHCPAASSGAGRTFLRLLSDLQDEFPECKILIHGLYSFRAMFGLVFGAADFEPRTLAAKSKVMLPCGKKLEITDLEGNEHWFELLGYHPKEMLLPRNRCMYNIRSAMWAGRHFREAVKFKHKGFEHVDPDDAFGTPMVQQRIMVRNVQAQEGDRYLCNVCSLQSSCRYFRVGAVCIVPDSEPTQLAAFFKTRDASQILDGMAKLMEVEVQRVTDARQQETDTGKLNPEVTNMLDKAFGHAEKFVKLVDPAFRKPGTQVTSNTLVLNGNETPQALMAKVIDYFVDQGIPRDQITDEMVMQMIQGGSEGMEQRVIEASATVRADPT